MFKKIFSVLFVTIIALTCTFTTVSAVSYDVIDDAQLLSAEELEEIKHYTKELSEKIDWNIAILFTPEMNTDDANMFAADYYDDLYGINTDGVIFMISFDPRKYAVITSGEAIVYLDDNRIDDILDDLFPYIKGQDYKGACDKYLYSINNYYTMGIPAINNNHSGYEDGHYVPQDSINPNHPSRPDIPWFMLFMGAGVGIIISLTTACFITVRYSRHKAPNTSVYLDASHSGYSVKQDTFIRTYKTSTYVGSPSSGGSSRSGGSHRSGGSSTFRSSSGGSHGGGSRSF